VRGIAGTAYDVSDYKTALASDGGGPGRFERDASTEASRR
jgi:hypothetical protein